MTRDELKQAIFYRLLSAANDNNRPLDGPVIDSNAIMALVDAYSVAIVQGVTPSYLPKPTDEEVLAWLKERK